MIDILGEQLGATWGDVSMGQHHVWVKSLYRHVYWNMRMCADGYSITKERDKTKRGCKVHKRTISTMTIRVPYESLENMYETHDKFFTLNAVQFLIYRSVYCGISKGEAETIRTTYQYVARL